VNITTVASAERVNTKDRRCVRRISAPVHA
jgi:hypothetical protein